MKGVKLISTTFRNIDVQELSAIADVLKVIAHPIRLEIIELLEVHKAMCVSDIQDKLNIEQSQLSHHLSKMKEKGVLKAERDGKNIFYSLSFSQITKIFDCMQHCYI